VEPGQLIDHYRLVSLVGAGGMGEVYRAVDERLRRDVAIKVLPHSGAPAYREARLLREAQAASHLNHPGIVTIHDVGRWADRTYIVMELVDGRRLSELAATDLGAARAIALCRQAAEAMAVAHERGILHRDIKPDNLMVTRDDRVKILDFGVAKVYDPSASLDPDPDPEADIETDPIAPAPQVEQLPAPPYESSPGLDDTMLSPPRTPATISVTRTGALLGTPAYMSPEQAAGAPVDERSEVYSLGLVLYELLTGLRPLQRATLMDTLTVAREPAIPPASTAARGRHIPRACDRLLERALARAPANRHPTMRALANDLAALEYELTRPRRAGRRWLFTGLALAALGAAGAAIAVVSTDDRREQRGAAPAIATTGVRRLTFDPGCEEMPSFWPDGRSIAFDAIVDGDTELVRMDLESGVRQRLTRNPGWDMSAQVSPDGRSIAFVRFTESGRTLMVMPWQDGQAGPARSLGLVRGYPGWTADGDILVGDDQGRILRIDPRTPGASPRVVASHAGYVTIEIEEMATGDALAAVRQSGQDPNRMELGLVHPGGALDMIDMAPVIDAIGIARDAGARGFYFADMTAVGPRLYWRSLDGRQQAELQALPLPYGGMAANRSGTALVLSNCRQVFQVGRFEGEGGFKPLFTGRDWNDLNVSALPDGSFVFASDRSGETQIWRGRPGETPHVVIDRAANFPAVSPDGKTIAWIATARDARGVYVSGMDGSAPRRITTGDSDDQPVFARDGQSLFFARGGSGGTRVFEVPVAGGEARPVTPLGVSGFAVAPDGRHLAWLAQTDAGREVMIGEPGGDGVRVPGLPSGNYTELSYGRDGKTLWLVRGGIEILTLSVDGTAPPAVVWHTTNDLIGFIAPDPVGGGIVGDLASYEGDIYLVEGRFR